jgi:hypothetical protein
MDSGWHRSSWWLTEVVLLLGWLTAVQAQPLMPATAGASLQRPVGARPIGLGGTYVAIANEPSGIFANPAPIAWLPPQAQLSATVSALGLGRTSAALAYAQAVSPGIGIGVGVLRFGAGELRLRTAEGIPAGTATAQDVALTLCGALGWEFLSTGLAAKYLWSGLSGTDISASGFAFDLGASARVAELLSLGVAVCNLGGRLHWASGWENLPYTVHVGIATEFNFGVPERAERSPVTGELSPQRLISAEYVLLGIELQYVQGAARPMLLLGIEAVPIAGLAVRAGTSLFADSEGHARWLPGHHSAAGISVQLPPLEAVPLRLQLDYSLSAEPTSPSRIAHTASLTASIAR